MNAVDDYRFETSKRDLAGEILKQATVNLQRFQDATGGVERKFISMLIVGSYPMIVPGHFRS